jgi:hypothetical protein
MLLAVVVVGGGVTLYTFSISNTVDIQEITESASDLKNENAADVQKVALFPDVLAREPSFAVDEHIWDKPIQQIADFPYIHPLCFDAIINSTKSLSTTNVNITSCNEKFKSIPVESEGGNLSIDATESYNDLTDSDSAPPNLNYEVIGKKGNTYYLFVNWNFSSPHYFSGVYAVILSEDKKSFTLSDKYVLGGDTCYGGINKVAMSDSLTYISSNASPTLLIDHGLTIKEQGGMFSFVFEEDYFTVPEHMACVGEIMTATDMETGEEKLISVSLREKIDASYATSKKVKSGTCFVETFNTYAKDTPVTLSPKQFQEFREKFYSCVQKP